MKKMFQIILIMFALLLMVGFGLCGLVGLSFGLVNNGDYVIPLLAIVGLIISGACGYWIYTIVRSMRTPNNDQVAANE